MKLTFYNRPYRIACLYSDRGKPSIPGRIPDICRLPLDKCLSILIPVKIDRNRRPIIEDRWLSLIKSFDPDFIIYNKDKYSDNFEVSLKDFSSFYIMDCNQLLETFDLLAQDLENSTLIQDDSTASLHVSSDEKIPGTISFPIIHENKVAHIYNSHFQEDWQILIPDEIDTGRIFDVQIFDDSGEKRGYRLPNNSLFRNILSRYNTGLEIRPMEYNGMHGYSVYPGSVISYNIFLLPNPREIPEKAFQEKGYSAHPARTNSFIDLFGGIRHAGEFLTKAYTIPLIERMIQQPYKSVGSVRKIISSRGVPDSVDTSTELLYMLSRRFLLRGFILKCERCYHQDFYYMKEVDETFLCRGCHREKVAPLKLPPAYRLNEIVRGGYRNGAIATILTLYNLFREARDSFIYSPELSLKAKNTEMEIDIICIVDGKIVVGEAKMGRLIKDRDFSPRDEFEKYKIVASEIGASRVVFATVQDSFYEIPLKKIDRFRRELINDGLAGVEVDILCGSELLDAGGKMKSE